MNETMFELSNAVCPVCVEVKLGQISLYDESLKNSRRRMIFGGFAAYWTRLWVH